MHRRRLHRQHHINTVIGSQGFAATGSVTNHVPITGGLDAEDDDELRERFRNTFLRNLAGTRDFYAALCLQSADVSKVKIVGPVEKYREQVQIQDMGNVTSGNNGAKFTLSLIHISEPTRRHHVSRMPSSA